MKIFETNFNKWSLKETISWDLLTNNWAEFKMTDKGLFAYFDWASKIDCWNSYNSYLHWAVPFSIYWYVNYDWNNYTIVSNQDSDPVGFLVSIFNSSISIQISRSISSRIAVVWGDDLKKWLNFFGVSYDGSWNASWVSIYTNWYDSIPTIGADNLTGVSVWVNNLTIWFRNYSTWSYFLWYLGLFAIEDIELSKNDFDNLYKEFIARKPLSTQKRNFYYPKPTRLNEDWLVAGYNMIPTQWELVDISGNGNDWTINWPLSTKGWLAFDGVDDEVISNNDLSTLWTCTILLTAKVNSYVWVNNHYFAKKEWWSYALRVVARNDGKIRISNNVDAVVESSVVNPLQEHTIAIVFDNWTTNWTKIYYNWEKVWEWTLSLTEWDWKIYIGSYAYANFMNLEIYDVRVYNTVLSEQQIKDYHNARVSQVYINEDFRYEKASWENILPIGWTPWTGSYKVVENAWLDGNSKALECTSAGSIALQSKQASGTWEFEIEKALGSNVIACVFIADKSPTSGLIISSCNGYYVAIGSNENLILWIANTTWAVALSYTANWYIQNWVPYWIKVERNVDGEFTLYIKWWTFGENYVLVDVSGWSWTNPVTNNTHTSCKYFLHESDTQDQIANIKLTKWVIL